MDHVEVELAIHDHALTPLKDDRRGDCCGIKFQAIGEGYYCAECDLFFHKTCSNPPERIDLPSHRCHKIDNSLLLIYNNLSGNTRCGLCRGKIIGAIQSYGCGICGLGIHMECMKYRPPKVIDAPQNHDHKLKLEMVESCFTCAACGEPGDGYSYKCHKCDLTFHVNCEKYEAEVTHPSHSLHPLKLLKGEPPAYTDGKCRLCGENLGNYEVYYHCSTCNFSLDMHCALNPPPMYLRNLNTHDHKLTLVPKLFSFTCTTCGLNGDRSPYVCLQCNFFAHNDCSGFPWVININRHDHRVSRTSLLGVVNSVCGVCQKKMDWSCGGYSCKRCPGSVFHTKCATREDVTDGKEMKNKPEEVNDILPFKVVDENTIQHFSHEEHSLRLDKSGIFVEERSCEACAYPIYHHSFYSCMTCNFMLHESCAHFPKKKRHMVSNKQYTLRTTQGIYVKCRACSVIYNGFQYYTYPRGIDVRCASVSEPFFHQSHPNHPLFYTSPRGVCSACKEEASHVLRCVEDDCEYVLDFKCALLPYEVKHRVDDHFLSLCYGENASGKYWCDICEKETNPKAWFYTCKDCGGTLHINCVLGDFRGLKPGSEVSTSHSYSKKYTVVRNSGMSRPLCSECKSHCIFPVILRINEYPREYFCSVVCCDHKYRVTFN